MRMAGIQVRFWMATMRFILSWLLAFFVALAGVVSAADDQKDFQRRLFERYDRKNVVSILPGLVLGLDFSEGHQPNFGVEYTHFNESIAIPQNYRLQEQLDERTFGDSDTRAAALDRLVPGERLYVSEFYTSRNGLVFYLVSPSITRFGRSASSGEKKFFGVKFTFEFPPNVMTSGDYETVVREVNKYLIPVSEYRTALQTPPRIEIQPGISQQEIINALGPPQQTVVFGKKTILNYSGISVELEDDRATDVRAH
jgi:hypothetical protein